MKRGEGTYQVEVDDLTGGFIVFVYPARPVVWMRPGYVAWIIIVIASTVAMAFALLRRRRLA